MSVMELGEDHETRRLVSDADHTLGLAGAHGGSPEDLHSSLTVMVTMMVAVWALLSSAVISTMASLFG